MKYSKLFSAIAIVAAMMSACSEDTLPTNTLPTFVTGDATDITRVSAILNGGIQRGNIKDMTEYGIMISTAPSFPDDRTVTQRIPVNATPENMQVIAEGLKMNQNYYYAPYATCGYNTVMGEVRNFVTLSTSAPSMSFTGGTLQPSSTSCEVTACVLDAGANDAGSREGLFMRGFVYKQVDDGDNLNFKSTDEGVVMITYDQDDVEFTQTINNLTPGTRYAVRPFGVLNGVGYGAAKEFQTITVSEPSLSTSELLNPMGNSIQLSARVIDQGSDQVVEKGFCYSTTTDLPTVDNQRIVDTSAGLDINVTLSNLEPGTTYYIRAYAINGTPEAPRYGYGQVTKHKVNEDLSFLDSYYTKDQVDAMTDEVKHELDHFNSEAQAAMEALHHADMENMAETMKLYNDLADQTKGNKEEINHMMEELGHVRTDYQKDIDELMMKCEDALAQQQTVLDELNHRVDVLYTRIMELENEMVITKEDVSKLQYEVDQLKQTISDMKTSTPMPVQIGAAQFNVLTTTSMQASASIDYAAYCAGYNNIYGVNAMYGQEYYATLYPIVMTGFVYSSVNANPNIENCDRMVVAPFDRTGSTISFVTTITGMKSGTTYYARAFAVNSFGTTYSTVETVITEKDSPNPGDNPFPDINNVKRHR